MAVHLVAGGAGYFGSVLVRHLLNKGNAVRIFDLNDSADRSSEVQFFQGDIRNREQLSPACQGVDVIHDAVAQVPLIRDKKILYSVNVDGSGNLFQVALEQKVRKIVYISSSAVFGIPERNPVDENACPRPLEPYGEAKYKAEQLARQYIERGLDITIIRPRTILGDSRLGIFSILFDWVRDGANIPVLGAGNNRYQFVHAGDLAEACVLASHRQGPAVYNVGAEKFGTMRELLEGLIAHAGTKSRVRSLPPGLSVAVMKLMAAMRVIPLAPYHWIMYGREMFFDLTKPKQELAWQPRYSNDEMIAESYDIFCEGLGKQAAQAGSVHQKPIKQGLLKVLKRLL